MFTRSRAVDSVADVRVKLFSKMHFDPVDTTTEVQQRKKSFAPKFLKPNIYWNGLQKFFATLEFN